ncbi:hypothetical protein BC833DRAFT_542016 [Globomyces pollinis-pini]|nr:hypothetical protein BC833DRAFT_542016 [Globomyces pollinis-pini]
MRSRSVNWSTSDANHADLSGKTRATPAAANIVKTQSFADDDRSSDSNIHGEKHSHDRSKKNHEEEKSNENQNQNQNDNTGFEFQKGSMHSLGSSQYSYMGSRGRELSESLFSKLVHAKLAFLALLLNVSILYCLVDLRSEHGLGLNFAGDIFNQAGAVIFEIWMHVTHQITEHALNHGESAFFGYLLTQKDGFSLSVLGYSHSGIFEKFHFAEKLSIRSKARKLLSRMSYISMYHYLTVFLSIFASTGISSEPYYESKGTLNCLEYGQDNVQVDRGWPNIEVEAGISELLFGTALGYLRSEEADLEKTTFLMSPQLIDIANDGTTIKGSGFTTDIKSTCECSSGLSVQSLINAGINQVKASIISQLALQSVDLSPNLISYLEHHDKIVNITTVLVGSDVCGGTNQTSPSSPVCTTTISNHHFATIRVVYMTDGTPASIAIKKTDLLETLEEADIQWLYVAFRNLLGGDVTAAYLPPTFPGTINPLLWWTTPNLATISPTLLEAGLETTYSILARGAMQRSYSTQGNTCTSSVISSTSTVLKIHETGGIIGLWFVLSQLLVTLISFLFFLPWFISDKPMGPAIKLAEDQNYFMIFLGSNPGVVGGVYSTMDLVDIWSKFDKTVRVGESISTQDDPDCGIIAMDRPKLVVPFSKTKLYQ